jgi:hypothetical protein
MSQTHELLEKELIDSILHVRLINASTVIPTMEFTNPYRKVPRSI